AGHEVAQAAAALPPFELGRRRRPDPADLSPAAGRRPVKIAARGRERLLYGRREVDLARVEQIVEEAQVRAIGHLIHRYAERHAHHPTLEAGLAACFAEVEEAGPDGLTRGRRGDLALPRPYEVAAALNRMRQVAWLA
ncbi:MAG: hypothetical protein D6739_10170, partial [Nitrospirae bacterium]